MPGVRELLVDAAKGKRALKDVDARGAALAGIRLFGLRADGLRADGADLQDADLAKAHLMDCDFVDASCAGASFGAATLWQCKFTGARARHADFHEMHAELNWWTGAELELATFDGSKLGESSFQDAKLSDASFVLAHGQRVSFSGATLVGAWLCGARFPDACFANANLERADLSFADLSGCDFRGARLAGARFGGAILVGAQFDGAPPATDQPPPVAQPFLRFQAYLAAGLAAECVALWRRMRVRFTEERCAQAIEPGDDPTTAVTLIAAMLDDPDPLVVEAAIDAAHRLAAVGRKLAVVPRLGELLATKPSVHVPRHGGEHRRTLDLARHAAVALGYLAAAGDADARATLDAGLTGKAELRQRCAGGLAVASAVGGTPAGLRALAASPDARVRKGVCEGLALAASAERFAVDLGDAVRPLDRVIVGATARNLANDDEAAVKKVATALAKRFDQTR
ncbi:MAG: pentapeptide repeat-containing protein [Deltaproteobacteria bacterium]|nr:pentapeptide repeat-containing protein [Deltaproteobacteria bacterium]